jgi:hypothetical protein
MLSRALSLATVMLLIGCFAAAPAWAQATNLEAGKSPSQIFAGTCTACHKSPRGLLKTVPAGSLQSFLRQHYTTSPEMASLLTSFLISNGATDTRYAQPKDGKDGKGEAKPPGAAEQLDRFGRRLRPAPQEAAKPEAEPREAAKPADIEGPPRGRYGKRLARPGEAPAAEGQAAPVQAAGERGPDGRKRLSRRGRPGVEELPKTESSKTESSKTESAKTDSAKTDSAKTEEPSKGEAAKDDQPKGEAAKEEAAKPSGEAKSESAKIETPKETGGSTPVLRPDPVPLVTPAPPAVSAAVSTGASEPASAPLASPTQSATAPAASAPSAPPPVTTASAPLPAPVAPAGPPAPPISQ